VYAVVGAEVVAPGELVRREMNFGRPCPAAAESPYRVHVFRGDPAALAPGREVVAVVLLPATFSLYRPLAVSWAGVEATVTLRR